MRRYFSLEKQISFLEMQQKTERFVMDRKTVQLGIYLRYKFNNRPGVFLQVYWLSNAGMAFFLV